MHLSQNERGVLAALLQSRLTALEQDRASELHGLTQAESARQTLQQDIDDAPQLAGEREVEGILSDIESDAYDAVRDALQRIHGVDYGLCVDCHAAIPFERLRIEPAALRCAACQTLHERQTLL